jgi:hypothetical protein
MTRKWVAVAAAAVAAVGLGGCLEQLYGWHYDQTKAGELKGTLRVTWVNQDSFLYEPDPADPLTFKRADGTTITPAAMFTDGGSIPLALRTLKGYSPWGYAPAFLIHDWLFVMKQCKLSGFEKYDLEAAATIMAEAMKTLMEKPQFGGPNKLVHYSMYEGVRSTTAKDYWDNGKCNSPGAAMERSPKPAATRSISKSAPSAAEAPQASQAPAAMPSFTMTFK